MTVDVQAAIRILESKVVELAKSGAQQDFLYWHAHQTLVRAIRHLAYPDRDTYPKTRRGTKGAPIVRR